MYIQQKDLSFFRLRLQELLNSRFPEKARGLKIIEQRFWWAINAYQGAFSAGIQLKNFLRLSTKR